MMKPFAEGIGRALGALLDAVAPQKARVARTAALTPEDIPLSPTVHDLLGLRITALMEYGNEDVAALAQSLKYDGSGRAARLLASAVADYLREEIASHRSFSQKEIYLVPVPLHTSRARERGFNQIAEVLKYLPPEFRNGPLSRVRADVLVRTRSTAQQTRLSRSARLSNVAGAFALANDAPLEKVKVFLIDDVATTGATLANAATPLRKAGAEVIPLALARA
jgi:ComF family protein